MKKIILVAGARPNFMKIAPILRAMKGEASIKPVLVHTGQHYDSSMSDTFFEDLGIPSPDFHLECGGGSHAEMTAKIMVAFEKLCHAENPDMVLVVGDVNSTIAAGLVAKKLQVTLIHVEAGLRSSDRNMPEEINRLATDAITDIFFTTEKSGTENLLKEGHQPEKVHFVGHVMIDNLFFQLEKLAKGFQPSENILNLKKQLPQKYLCMTLHRPSNVDNKNLLIKILETVADISQKTPVIFPCHPRTKKKIIEYGLDNYLNNEHLAPDNGLIVTDPMGYDDFLYLWKDAAAMLTDSGGLQEETTALGVPCLTLRENTERPITIATGSNILIGSDMELLKRETFNILNGKAKKGKIPELWDGKASERMVEILKR